MNLLRRYMQYIHMIKVTLFSLSSFSLADISRISYYAGKYMHFYHEYIER